MLRQHHTGNNSNPHTNAVHCWCAFSYAVWCGVVHAALAPNICFGQIDYESKPINYRTFPASNPIQVLQGKMASGEVKLDSSAEHGFLTALLKHLDIPVSSQMLVFSKTSFQRRRINSQRPRAVYFNDDVYVGWVQDGDVIEISTADPQLGGVFYTLNNDTSKSAKILRDGGQCTLCHSSSRTAGVPGHFVRSVFASASGQPFAGTSTYTTDYRSPLSERWGGWYVTGEHGKQRHLGNSVVTDRLHPQRLDIEVGANVIDLSDRLDVEPYLSAHSDIVALMVLEHQARTQNLITRTSMATRIALESKAENPPQDWQEAAEKLIECLLFADEAKLTSATRGSSTFTADFTSRGLRDSQQRSLRDFDLKTRMMKYPCSYLIYSKPFQALPKRAKDYVLRRLFDILTERDSDDPFQHLKTNDRVAIIQILRETMPNLPIYWKEKE
jgi:hypothetical protein